MTQQFHELLLSELSMVAYRPGDPAGMTDDTLCRAVTANENLRSLGLALRPDDIVRLAASPALDTFFEDARALVPDVKARPMYPDFPGQVMEMDEAVFRLHQQIHYFTTYGLETLLGEQVQKGWLPDAGGTEKTRADQTLLRSRVISLIPEAEAPAAVLKALLNRRERLTNPEVLLVLECLPQCTEAQLSGLTVRFKENQVIIFPYLMRRPDSETVLHALRALCAHTGDVLRCAGAYLSEKRWHLTTREKKRIVRLLESYREADLRDNLMQSLRLRERNLRILERLDYDRFSRSLPHKKAVQALRDGTLQSWHGEGEKLLRDKSPEALRHYAGRPGYMVRALNRLVSLDYDPHAILGALLPHAGLVSGHLAVRTVSGLLKRRGVAEEQYRQDVRNCEYRYEREAHASAPDLKWMRQQAEWEESQSRHIAELRLSQQEKEARRQAAASVRTAERELSKAEEELSVWENARIMAENSPQALRQFRVRRNGGTDVSGADSALLSYWLFYRDEPDEWQAVTGRLEAKIAEKQAVLDQARQSSGKVLRERLEAAGMEYRSAMDGISRAYTEKLNGLTEQYDRQLRSYREAMRTLPARKESELKALRESYLAQRYRIEHFDEKTVGILKALIKEHFRHAQTPLKGKKVWSDMKQFDLRHSVLETENRSKDGGYIRSGICYQIPEKARYVRFFVYWNDSERVDIDLHAGGKTTDGEPLHIGWNADFRYSGVVHSGDITHSNAAEYIDIDLSAPIKDIWANTHLFCGKRSFREIRTCYVGLMAVSDIGQDVKLYDPKNCFFTHRLTQDTRNLFYGVIDVQNRFIRFVGQPNESGGFAAAPALERADSMFSLQDYLDIIMEAQGAVPVSRREDADITLTMGKSLQRNAVSLVDSNFFLES